MEIILNSYGSSLNRANEAFIVSTDDRCCRVPPRGIKSIQISKATRITSDAVMLAVENEIDLLFVDYTGRVLARVWSPKYGSIATIRKGQLKFSLSAAAVDWIKDIICEKIENQKNLIWLFLNNIENSKKLSKVLRRLDSYSAKISSIQGESVKEIAPTIRAWEGQVSKIYFSEMNKALPVSLRFNTRSKHPAKDVANAFLNYGYGILYGKIEVALIKAGIDPYIGILHSDEFNRPALVYDVIEIYRVWIDTVVYKLLSQTSITEEFYSVKGDGSYWLEPLGRQLLIQSVYDSFEEKIKHNSRKQARMTILNNYVKKLAQVFKSYEQDSV